MSAENNLDQFQDDLVARLRSDSFFDEILIIEERRETAYTQVQKASAGELAYEGKYGAWLLVELPEMEPEPNLPGPQYVYRAVIQTRVIPKYNDGQRGTQKQAGTIAERVDALLHCFQNHGQAWQVEKVEPFSDPITGAVGYDHFVTWHFGLDPLRACRMPSISESALTVTLACETPGAAIYYTIDDSFPWSGNDEATLYTAPFVAPGDITLRAAAYRADLAGSGVTSHVTGTIAYRTTEAGDTRITEDGSPRISII